ncbi:glutathione peroxidase [Beggiatoa alba B18LD]|uniref:Glutathione peroxidase n=2 Tax=Beggiatoa alba TaxID=1022 RepID=I3CF92_9GAMM|nr:glutathione peroxidase [Beggiatoa alba]EIJ42285.1 glutathione peroxidase [Beggiatoa alba B18LD]
MNKYWLSTLFMLYAVPSSTLGACPKTLDFDVRPLTEKQTVNLCTAYQGKVVLIVNTASKCGYTPQYEGLEALYRKYRDQGLVILGFPSNDFGGQEPGSETEIQSFCRLTYGVEFPMFEKVSASEKNPHPLYQMLANLAGEYPRWNFHKYLLDKNGTLVGSYPSRVKPDDPQFIDSIETLLKQ